MDRQRETLIVVIPAYNRYPVLRRSVAACLAAAWPEPPRILVIDDASPDESGRRIVSEFPEVTVLQGTGQLWWAGCINMGMEFAFSQRAEFVLWLNEDCFLNPAAASALWHHRNPRGIVTLRSLTPGGTVYGGWQKRWWSFEPVAGNSATARCDAMSGNCVLVARRVYESIGGIHSRRFPQAYGDLDFGLRARRAAIPILQVNLATCENLDHDDPVNLSLPWQGGPRTIWRKMTDPRSHLNVAVRFRFYVRYRPLTWVVHLAMPYVAGVFQTARAFAEGRFFSGAAPRSVIP